MKNKVFTFFIIIAILMTIAPVVVYGSYGGIDTIEGEQLGHGDDATASEDIINNFIATFRMVGTIAAVIAIMVIGIRYMTSSVEEKADIKGILGYYLVGALLVLSTVNFVAFVYNIINDI